ncbi:MAG: hypothetical protein WBP83_01890 [Nitrososphaeraceae archaeon]
MGKKNTEINVIKNPQDQDPTFVSDPMKELMLRYSNQHENKGTINSNENTKKLVKKARHDSRFSKSDLRNKSKQGLSKQNHSPVYE